MSDSESENQKRLLDGYFEVRVVKRWDITMDKYLVGWEGYASDDDTWEPRDNICHTEPFKKFEAKEKLKQARKVNPGAEEWREEEHEHKREAQQEQKDMFQTSKLEPKKNDETYECSHCKKSVSQPLLESITSKGAMICLDCFVAEALNKSLPPISKEEQTTPELGKFTSPEAAKAEEMFLSAIKGNKVVTNDTTASKILCICKLPDTGEQYLTCKQCNGKFHPRCVNISETVDVNTYDYTCTECASIFTVKEEDSAVNKPLPSLVSPEKKLPLNAENLPLPPLEKHTPLLENVDARRLLSSAEAQEELKSLVIQIRPMTKEKREDYIDRVRDHFFNHPTIRIRRDVLDREWFRDICGKAFNASNSAGTLVSQIDTRSHVPQLPNPNGAPRCGYCNFPSSTGSYTKSGTIPDKDLCNSCAWYERTFQQLIPRNSRPQTLPLGSKSMNNKGRWCDFCFRPSSASTARLSKCKSIPGIMICRACYNHEKDFGTLVRAEHARRAPAKRKFTLKERNNKCTFCGKLVQKKPASGQVPICNRCATKNETSSTQVKKKHPPGPIRIPKRENFPSEPPPLQIIESTKTKNASQKRSFPKNKLCDLCFKPSEEFVDDDNTRFYASKRFKGWFLCPKCTSKDENSGKKKATSSNGEILTSTAERIGEFTAIQNFDKNDLVTVSFSERPFGFQCDKGKGGNDAFLKSAIPQLGYVPIGSKIFKVNTQLVLGLPFHRIRELVNSTLLPCEVTFLKSKKPPTPPPKPGSLAIPSPATKRKLELTPPKTVKRQKTNPSSQKREQVKSDVTMEVETEKKGFEPPTVEAFLTRLAVKRKNKKFKDAAKILKKEGMDFLSIKFCSFEDVQDFGIPRWIWSNIRGEAKLLEENFRVVDK